MRFVEVPVPCGNTDPYGSVALCPKCEHKRKSINERSAYINSLAPSNWETSNAFTLGNRKNIGL